MKITGRLELVVMPARSCWSCAFVEHKEAVDPCARCIAEDWTLDARPEYQISKRAFAAWLAEICR